MELIVGKKFKLPIWERALKTMWINEVAKFSVDKEVYSYFNDYNINYPQLQSV